MADRLTGMKNEDMERLSRFIAYVLRHNPSAVGVALDKHGWANVDELLYSINRTGRQIDFGTLCGIIKNDGKMRFSFNDDKTKIRANQGHSIAVDVQMTESVPPDILYHGTAEKYMESIRQFGLLKKSRNFVHLSKDKETAAKVGARHGRAVVLTIDAKRMVERGYKFYLSANGVWQTGNVPREYIKEIKDLNNNKKTNEQICTGETFVVNPKLCNQLTIQVEVHQKGEKNIPHVHVYHDKTRNPKQCSCVCLDRAAYCFSHGDTLPLPPKLKDEFIGLMSTTSTRLMTKEKLTGYEIAVDIWVNTYEDDYGKFTFNDKNGLVMPDYRNLP